MKNANPKPPVDPDDFLKYGRIISLNLLRLRAERNVRQSELGEYLGLTNSGYGDYERKRCPDAATLMLLAKYYDIPVASFFVEYDKNGNIINKELVRGAETDSLAELAEGLNLLAENMSSNTNERLEEFEKRIKQLEQNWEQMKKSN